MSHKEVERLRVLDGVLRGQLSQSAAAEQLGLSSRQLRRLQRRYEAQGEQGLVHGSPHDWFEGRSPRCTLLVFIDDATSELMALRFVPAETTTAYLLTLRAYILAHGLPVCLYSDRHSIFRSTHQDNPQPTLFEQALQRLGIDALQASSPQAKGRVERAHQTLQDRLVKAMRLAGIDHIEAANPWLDGYVRQHNQRFAITPVLPEDAHVPYLGTEPQLDQVMAYRHRRRLSRTLSCQFRQQLLQIDAPGQQRRLAGQQITLIEQLDGRLSLQCHGQNLRYHASDRRRPTEPSTDTKNINDRVQNILKTRSKTKPTASHPWKAWQGATPNPRLHLTQTP